MLEGKVKFFKDIAIVIEKKFKRRGEGIVFITREDSCQQVGIMRWPDKHVIKRHYHNPQKHRIVPYTQEIIVVRSGLIQVILYDEDKRKIENIILMAGDIICFLKGSHEIIMLKNSELLEIKQGPYLKENDKTRW